MEKVLYFEGAGVDSPTVQSEYNGINCRIRTAFTNNAGRKLFLELQGVHLHHDKRKRFSYPKTSIYLSDLFVIAGNSDDCCYQLHPISYEKMKEVEYTLENICEFVNKYCGCSFDRVEVLPWLAGYRVFKEGGKGIDQYSYGDEFCYDVARTERMTQRVEELSDKFCRELGMRNGRVCYGHPWDNTSYWCGEDGKLHVRLNISSERLSKAGYAQREWEEIV